MRTRILPMCAFTRPDPDFARNSDCSTVCTSLVVPSPVEPRTESCVTAASVAACLAMRRAGLNHCWGLHVGSSRPECWSLPLPAAGRSEGRMALELASTCSGPLCSVPGPGAPVLLRTALERLSLQRGGLHYCWCPRAWMLKTSVGACLSLQWAGL